MNETKCKVTVPILTPLTENGKFDCQGFEKLVEHCVGGGVTGFLILGTCGEGYNHTEDFRLEIVRSGEKSLSGFKGMRLYGVLEHSTDEAVEFIQKAMKLGAGEFAIVPPYYDAVAQEDIVRHYEKIAEETHAKIYIYNLPSLTGVNIDLETIKILKRLPGVLGMKNSSGDMFYFIQLLSQVKTGDFSVHQGSEELIVPSILLGADGIVPCGANVFPAFFAWLSGHVSGLSIDECAGVFRLSKKILDLQNMTPYWIASLKGACESLGLIRRGVGAPYAAMDEKEFSRCKETVILLRKQIEEAIESKR